ncbi:MAG TPA: hypothetical protein VG273_28345 [Bryobacteraceae bacterium]|jgi:hypothetical protein|nr:hypothetical protein [Bryobacteraceae bacterium]
MTTSSRAQSQSGYALLLVLAMAAVVAITLYMEVPRVAFEAQRDKEQLLIDRGEQYSRAIQLYVRKFNRYPPDFAALESTQNLRFLRRRYTDPMNSKKPDSDQDNWRIVHVGPGGVFTDSLVYNVKKDGQAAPAEKQTFIIEMQQTGGNPVDPNQAQINPADRRRQSTQAGMPTDPNNPNGYPAVPGSQPVLPPGFQLPPGAQMPPGLPGTQSSNGSPLPGQMPAGGVPLPPGVQIPGVNTPAGQFNGQTNGQSSGGPPSAAVNMINNLLTTPRPGGFAGLNGAPSVDQFGNPLPGMTPNPQGAVQPGAATVTPGIGTAAGQPMAQTIGGGIAGVASKITQDGIKIYKDQKTYNKWEFVYDITKDTTRNGAAQMPQQTPPPGTPIAPPMGVSPAPGAVPGVNPGMTGNTPGTTPPPASPTTP